MNKQRIINASIDCISRFRASAYPLKNIASDIIKARKLNSHDRGYFLDLVFAWARESYLITNFLKNNMRFFDGLSNQQKDTLALNLLALSDPPLKDRYEKFLKNLGESRYLLALGDFFASELINSHGSNAAIIAKGLWQKPNNYLAFDSRILTLENIREKLAEDGLCVSSHPLAPHALKIQGVLKLDQLSPQLREHIWLMDAGSQIIANCVRPKAHERVLDLCAGEGGKTHLIALQPCDIVALDIDEARLSRAKKRLSAFNIKFLCADGVAPPLEPSSFDWILIDAPCSGSGVLRRNPDLIYRLTKASLINYQKLQRELLTSAIRLLKPNGKLIYATCSLFKSENQQQIARVLSENANLMPYELGDLDKTCIELMPHIYDCDGFYVAGLTKTRQ